jgi:RNA recognition motif-containing protein
MSKRLFVGNLSFDINEDQLVEAFSAFGATGATIPTSDSGRPKGFGFVDIADDQLQAAIAGMDGKDLGGRTIAVNEAKPRPDFSGGGGGRGGYGGGGGYGGSQAAEDPWATGPSGPSGGFGGSQDDPPF